MLCIIWKICVLCGSMIVAKMLNSDVPDFSDLTLTISVLPATVITELSTNQNKHMRHSAAFKNQQWHNNVINNGADQYISLLSSREKQLKKDQYLSGFGCFDFFFSNIHIKLDMEYWQPEALHNKHW